MASRTIKKWITINGNHIPVYEDGSIGGAAEKMGLDRESSDTSDISIGVSKEEPERLRKLREERNKAERDALNAITKAVKKIEEKEANEENNLSNLSDEQLKETAKNTLASGNAEATFALSQEAARRGWKSLNGPDIEKSSNEGQQKQPHIDPVSKALIKDNISIGDGVDRVPSKYNSEEQADAISYMYGIPLTQARQDIVDGKYSDDDIKRSILYQETEGLPSKYRRETYERSLEKYGLQKEVSSTKSIKVGDREVGVAKTKPASSEELYDKANAAYKKSEARSQKAELARAKETGDYSGVFASTYLKMPISEIRSIGRQLGLSDFALSGNKSQIIADILRAKRKK